MFYNTTDAYHILFSVLVTIFQFRRYLIFSFLGIDT